MSSHRLCEQKCLSLLFIKINSLEPWLHNSLNRWMRRCRPSSSQNRVRRMLLFSLLRHLQEIRPAFLARDDAGLHRADRALELLQPPLGGRAGRIFVPGLRRRMNIELNFPPNFEGLVLGCIDADFCK